jgi:Tol biopolymer transport system component
MTVAGSDPIALITTPNTDSSGRISPSGDWIAYASDNRGQTHVYVERFRLASADAQQTPLCTISTSSGYDPHWGEGDTELYYLERGGNLMRATLDLSGGCNPARREVVFRSTVETPGISRNHYAIDFAQQRLLFNTPVSEASPFNIHTNWLERLDR